MTGSYNFGARYEILGRVTEGTTVCGYVIKDRSNGNVEFMDKGKVESLALKKNVYNCTAQVYRDIINLKGINCKLNQLPKFDVNGNRINKVVPTSKKVVADLKIIGKITNGRYISDYVVISKDNPSKKMKLPREIVLKLAEEGRIMNAKSQVCGNTIVLRGDMGQNLSELKVYEN